MGSRSAVAAVGVALLLVDTSIWAEPAATGAADASGLEEIVVTAERKEEPLQKVGIAISVLSGESLADKSITYVNDLQNAVPSLQVEPAFGSGQPQFRLRGVGFIDYTSNNASPVGVSLDEVALALPIETQGQLFDIDRVEVLRGPQGTLYGRNTTGGQINFITNRPTTDPHAGLTVEYGSFNEFTAEGFVSGPLAPGLTGRLSVATEQGGGWQHNRLTGAELGDKDKVALRAQLQWDPVQAVDLRLNAHWAMDQSEQIGLHLLDPYTPYNAGAGGPTIPADTDRYVTGWQLDPAFANILGISPNSKPSLDNANYGVDLISNLDFGPAKLTSVSAYERMIRREYGDWDATQYYDSDEYFRSYLNVISEEARIASTGTGPLSWLGGVFYSDQRLEENFYSDFSDADIGFPPGTTPVIVLTKYHQHAQSIGEFGQVNYQFNDAFKATLGAREDHETRELQNLNTGIVVGPPIATFTGVLNPPPAESNLPSGKAELDYTPLAGTMFYASISRGVKSGGFTAHNTTTAPAVDPFEPEKLTAYELGVKSDVTRTLRVDAAVFYYRYRDQQILGKVLDELSKSYIGRFVNADSRISGGEVEAEWHPVGGLAVSQYAGFAEGYYTSTLLNSSNVDYDGRPESFPKWSYGGDVSYEWGVGSYRLTAESNYSFHDTYSQFYLLGSSAFTIPKYWLANANLSLAPAGGPWTLSLWGRNIFNKVYDTTRNFFLPGTNIAQSGAPATFGIRFGYRY
ncbi:MAG TPA: TonB-dependent receptor [Steroidobacteraceae bacterium]|nr:TonB-dependent receptor [Steroidobacteraceae bacterium]